MKKNWLLIVLLVLIMVCSLALATACGGTGDPTQHTEHKDLDGDGKCDIGGEAWVDPNLPKDPVYGLTLTGSKNRTLSLGATDALNFVVKKDNVALKVTEYSSILKYEISDTNVIRFSSDTNMVQARAEGTATLTLSLKDIAGVDPIVVTYTVKKDFWGAGLVRGSVELDNDEKAFYFTGGNGNQFTVGTYDSASKFAFSGDLDINRADVKDANRNYGIGSFVDAGDHAIWFNIRNLQSGAIYDTFDVYIHNFYNGWTNPDEPVVISGCKVLKDADIHFELVRDGATYYYTIGNYVGVYTDPTGKTDATHPGFFSQETDMMGVNCDLILVGADVDAKITAYTTALGQNTTAHVGHGDIDPVDGLCDFGGEVWVDPDAEEVHPNVYTVELANGQQTARELVFGKNDTISLVVKKAGVVVTDIAEIARVLSIQCDNNALQVAANGVVSAKGASFVDANATITITIKDKTENPETITVNYTLIAPLWNMSVTRGDMVINDDNTVQINGDGNGGSPVLVTYASSTTFAFGGKMVIQTQPVKNGNSPSAVGIGSFVDNGNHAFWVGLANAVVNDNNTVTYELQIKNFYGGWSGVDTWPQQYSALTFDVGEAIDFQLVRVGDNFRYNIGGYHGEFSAPYADATYAGFYTQGQKIDISDATIVTDATDVQAIYDGYASKQATIFDVNVNKDNGVYKLDLVSGDSYSFEFVRFPAYTAQETLTLRLGEYAGTVTLTDGLLTVDANAPAGTFHVDVTGGGYTFAVQVNVEAAGDPSEYTLTVEGEDAREIVFNNTSSDTIQYVLQRNGSTISNVAVIRGLVKVEQDNNQLVFDYATGKVTRNPDVAVFTDATTTFTFSVNGKASSETFTVTYTLVAPLWNNTITRGDMVINDDNSVKVNGDGNGGSPALVSYAKSTTFVMSGYVVIGSQPIGANTSIGIASWIDAGDKGVWFGLQDAQDNGDTVRYEVYIRSYYNGWPGADIYPEGNNNYTMEFAKGTAIKFEVIRNGNNYRYTIGNYHNEITVEYADATYAGFYTQGQAMDISGVTMTTDAVAVQAAYDAYAQKAANVFTFENNSTTIDIVAGDSHDFTSVVKPAYVGTPTLSLDTTGYASADGLTLEGNKLTVASTCTAGSFVVKATLGEVTKQITVNVKVAGDPSEYDLEVAGETARNLNFGNATPLDTVAFALSRNNVAVTDAAVAAGLLEVTLSNSALKYTVTANGILIERNANSFSDATATLTMQIKGREETKVTITYTLVAPFWTLETDRMFVRGAHTGDVMGDTSSFTAYDQNGRLTYANGTTWAFTADLKLDAQEKTDGEQFGIASMLNCNDNALWIAIENYAVGTEYDTFNLKLRRFYGGWAGDVPTIVDGLKVPTGQPIPMELVRVGGTYYITVAGYHTSFEYVTENCSATTPTYAGLFAQNKQTTATNCTMVTDAEAVNAIVAGYANKAPRDLAITQSAASLQGGQSTQLVATVVPAFV